MAGKLSIRRVGTLLPTICLLGGLLVLALLIWLCTAGLPSCALRYIENQAAAHGVPLSVKRIKIAPRSGFALKAQDVTLHYNQQDAAPATLFIKKAQVEFSLTRILMGNAVPLNIQLRSGRGSLPLSENEQEAILLDDLNIYITLPREGKSVRGNISANIQGIDLKGVISIADYKKLLSDTTQQEGSSGTTNTLSQVRLYLQAFRNHISNQNWENVAPPYLNFNIQHREDWSATLQASLPHYDVGQFRFRDAVLKAEYNNDRISVSQLAFKTVKPDTKVQLQATYNILNRELSFKADSSAPIIRILQQQLEGSPSDFLNKIQAIDESTPSIALSGVAEFAENYALNRIILKGNVEYQQVKLGDSTVTSAKLSFFLQDTNFNIDNLHLNFSDGEIHASACAANGEGSAKVTAKLPAERILTLARDFSGNEELRLPEHIRVNDVIDLHLEASICTNKFEPGKTRITDLLPSLRNFDVHLKAQDVIIGDTQIQNPAIMAKASGLNLGPDKISVDELSFSTLLGKLHSPEQGLDINDLLVVAKVEQLQLADAYSNLSAAKTELRINTSDSTIDKAQATSLLAIAEIQDISANLKELKETLATKKVQSSITASGISYADTELKDCHISLHIPEGLTLREGWNNLKQQAELEVDVNKVTAKNDFSAESLDIQLQCTPSGESSLHLQGLVNGNKVATQAMAQLRDDAILDLQGLRLELPLSSFNAILGDAVPSAIKIPDMVTLTLTGSINTKTGQVTNCKYDVHIPQLVRVCQNVHVRKGMEIPLELDVRGTFHTRDDGSMHYDANVEAVHKRGILDIHVSGNPLKECHITGSNSIPVDVVNALIDNGDAHWIMRDFRCTPGKTRTLMRNIAATIRYDKGIYVQAHCDAELHNIEYILGAIRDKEDAKGNPTGEEYLRTDLGPNPYTLVKYGTCGVDVLVQLDCQDANGKPLKDKLSIILQHPDLLYDNKPWLKRQNITKGVLTSRIQGEAIVFDLDNYTISLHNLRGVAYPAYSIGMYYSPIQSYMSDIELQYPARIETAYCIFPLSRHCKIPMKGLIHAEAAKGAGFRFLGTTIPLKNFTGFINISDTDVYLDRMNAESWGGVLNGALRIDFSGEHTTLDGYFVARNMNLQDIVKSYGVDFSPAHCDGEIRFQASQPELEAVQAYGRVHLKDGDLMQISLFRPISALLSDMPGNLKKLQESVHIKDKEEPPSWVDKLINLVFRSGRDAVDIVQDSAYKVPFANHFIRYSIDEAYAKFDIHKGHLISRNMKAKGYNLDVNLQLDLDLNDLTLKGNLWPKISSVPTAIISPVTVLSDFLIDINLYGDVLNPQWKFSLSEDLEKFNPLPHDEEKSAK